MKFKKGQITRLHTQMPLRMLLTNTQVGRNTKALVAGVGERALRHPAAMGAIFKAIDEIAEEVVTILQTPPETARLGKSGEVVSSDECGPHPVAKTVQEIRLQELVDMNQGLLQGIGVSHLSIESICQITAAYRLSSKLTGAGGGGCVLTLLPHSILTQLLINPEFSFYRVYCCLCMSALQILNWLIINTLFRIVFHVSGIGKSGHRRERILLL